MSSASSKDSISKSELKKRIMRLHDNSASGLTNSYLDSLDLKKLKDIYLIAKTMKIKKNA